MNYKVFNLGILLVTSMLIGGCSNQEVPSIESQLKDPVQQEKILSMLADDHRFSDKYISKMMSNDHAQGMMVDKLVDASSKDTDLANKLSESITGSPDLMLLTMHHFLPVINADEAMCEGFCDHAMEHPEIAQGMCHEIKANETMSCCN